MGATKERRRPRRSFTKEFKGEVVEPSASAGQHGGERRTGPRPDRDRGPGVGEAGRDRQRPPRRAHYRRAGELTRLRRENRVLREERDIRKRATAFLGTPRLYGTGLLREVRPPRAGASGSLSSSSITPWGWCGCREAFGTAPCMVSGEGVWLSRKKENFPLGSLGGGGDVLTQGKVLQRIWGASPAWTASEQAPWTFNPSVMIGVMSLRAGECRARS